MKKLIFFTLVLYTSYFAYQKYHVNAPPPAVVDPYIVVYGRTTCGNTKRMMRELDRAGVRYGYRSVDNRPQTDELHQKMLEAGIPIASYMLPVVDVTGKIHVNPPPQDVITNYRASKS